MFHDEHCTSDEPDPSLAPVGAAIRAFGTLRIGWASREDEFAASLTSRGLNV